MRKTITLTLVALLIVGLLAAAVFLFKPSTDVATQNGDKGEDGWTLIYDSRSLKAYPDLKEYVWYKNANMAPDGVEDKIGLHRLVKADSIPKGVVFICFGSTVTGESLISNPENDSFTKSEAYGPAIYWANRGFDVYSMDDRRFFVFDRLKSEQLSFMKDWGWDVWISDLKEAVLKIKDVSGADKLFMAGLGTGATITMNYASRHWQEDLNGMILMNTNTTANPNPTNTYKLPQAIIDMNTTGNWAKTIISKADKDGSLYAALVPDAPAVDSDGQPFEPSVNPLTSQSWANITEFLSFAFHYASDYPPGGMSNLLGGVGNVTELLYNFGNSPVYTPTRIDLETAAIADWVNCPYITYDFDDHYKDIDIPVLVFASELYMNSTGQFAFTNGFATDDFTTIYLPEYGLYDPYFGKYSITDVSQPALNWLTNHLPTQ